MKTIKPIVWSLSVLLMLGAIPEVQATVIQPIGLSPQQDNIVLARGGHHGGHGHGHGHWRGGGGRWHGGGGWAGGLIVAPGLYYGPSYHRVCHWNSFGQYVCPRWTYY